MIDRYLSFTGQLKAPVFEADFGPHKSTSEKFYASDKTPASDTLTAVFGFWHASSRNLVNIGKRLNKGGSDALIYDLHPDILNDDPALVRESFEQATERATGRIQRLQKSTGYKKVNLLGFSTGNIPLAMTASSLEHFDDVAMVVPGSDLFNCLWYGMRTKRLQRMLAEKDSAKNIEREWADCAPIAHVPALKGHDVHVVLSAHDKFIPYRYGQKLVAEMVAQGVNPQVTVERRLGHALTIAKYIAQM